MLTWVCVCAHVCECLCVHAHLPVQCHFKLVVVVVIQSCPSLSDPMTVAHQAPRPWDSPDKNTGVKKKKKKNTGVGCHSLLQWIFSTQGSKPGLQHCRQILYGGSYWEVHHFKINLNNFIWSTKYWCSTNLSPYHLEVWFTHLCYKL